MRIILSFILALITSIQVSAQSIEFVSIEQNTNDLDAQKYPIYYGENRRVCALVKVQLPLRDVVFENDFIIGESQYKVNEYWVYMADGAAKLDVKHPNCPKLSVSFGMKLESKMTYSLVLKADGFNNGNILVAEPVAKTEEVVRMPENRVKLEPATETHDVPAEKNADSHSEQKTKTDKAPYTRKNFSLYLGPQFQPLSFSGVGGFAGVYIKRFNMQLDYIAGMEKSDKVYWNNTTMVSASSYSYEYTPSYLGVSMGCAIADTRSFRLAPQIGIGAVMLNGKEVTQGTNDPKATSGYATSAQVGARMDIRFSRSFGIFLAPQYRFAVSKSDLFDRVAAVSETVKSYADGFCGNVGFYLEF